MARASSNSVLKRAFERLGIEELLGDIERHRLARTLRSEPAVVDYSRLTAAVGVALLATDGVRSFNVDEREKFGLLAHAMCDAHDLIGTPSHGKRAFAEQAALLFVKAGELVKAGTIANRYVDLPSVTVPTFKTEGEGPIAAHVCTERALWALYATRVHELPRLAADAKFEVGRTAYGLEGYFLYFLAALLNGLHDELTAQTSRLTEDQLQSRCELLLEASFKLNDSRLHFMAECVVATGLALYERSLAVLLRQPNLAFGPTMHAALLGKAAKSKVFTVWPAQERALRNGLLNHSYVVSAPTSSGKTLVAEFKIARYLETNTDGLAVYVAPYNELARQVQKGLSDRFAVADISEASILTGAYATPTAAVNVSSILVTTPETLDAILRGTDARSESVRSRVGLFIFDECHLVGLGNRGITYELLITRIRARFPRADVLAMSAVASNANKIASWIGNNTGTTVDDWTPTKRRLLILRRDGKFTDTTGTVVESGKKLKTTKDAAADLAARLSNGPAAPTLVMCNTRSAATDICERVYLQLDDCVSDRIQLARLALADVYGSDAALPRMIARGVAYHHAGMQPAARELIVDLVKTGDLRCVVSTTTLAEGVHLPFRSLVLPYVSFPFGTFMERGLFQNVIGRVGRAFADVDSTVVVIEPESADARKKFYSNLIGHFGETIEVSSRLSASATGKLDRLADQLALERQIIGFVGDQTLLEDQVRLLASNTLAVHLGTSRTTLARTFQRSFERIETNVVPALCHASPYKLTPHGEAASRGGISDLSALALRRENEHMNRNANPWVDYQAWSDFSLSPDLAADIARLITTPLEFASVSAQRERGFGGLADTMREWASHRDSPWNEMSSTDRYLLKSWTLGHSTTRIVSGADEIELDEYPFKKKWGLEKRASTVAEYFEHGMDMFMWMLSAAIHMTTQYLKETDTMPPPFARVLALFEAGVPSEIALRISRLGVPRHLATELHFTLALPRDTEDYKLISELRPALRRLLQANNGEDKVRLAAVMHAIS